MEQVDGSLSGRTPLWKQNYLMLKYVIINMEDLIIGTWWLVATSSGKRYITKAKKVISVNGAFLHSTDQMRGWVGLDDDLQGTLITKEGDKKVKPEYFKGLNFPEVTKETSPIEIEIGKSGRVYTYDS